MIRPTKKWWRIAELYRRFAAPWDHIMDFGDAAAAQMFAAESSGAVVSSENNGFALGKRQMDVTVTMWREDIKAGLLRRCELESEFPGWWLDRVLRS